MTTQPIMFGRYALLKRIAVGGMAEVFRAVAFGAEGFEKVVALKRMLPHMSRDPQFVDMFINEAKLAAMLNHAHIVQIYDFGNLDNLLFLCMEYVHGKDLSALIRKLNSKGFMAPVELACFLLIEVLHGLEYAHKPRRRGGKLVSLIHRDVSPPNILISYSGEVKIADFGIAKVARETSTTGTGVLKGKYCYMSPEQATGQPLDQRTDLFSLGIAFYELLTQTDMFPGKSEMEILEKVRSADFVKPREVNSAIPKKLERILLRALERDPNDRYADATAWREEVERFLVEKNYRFSTAWMADFMKDVFGKEMEEEQEELDREAEVTTSIRPSASRLAELEADAAGELETLSRPKPDLWDIDLGTVPEDEERDQSEMSTVLVDRDAVRLEGLDFGTTGEDTAEGETFSEGVQEPGLVTLPELERPVPELSVPEPREPPPGPTLEERLFEDGRPSARPASASSATDGLFDAADPALSEFPVLPPAMEEDELPMAPQPEAMVEEPWEDYEEDPGDAGEPAKREFPFGWLFLALLLVVGGVVIYALGLFEEEAPADTGDGGAPAVASVGPAGETDGGAEPETAAAGTEQPDTEPPSDAGPARVAAGDGGADAAVVVGALPVEAPSPDANGGEAGSPDAGVEPEEPIPSVAVVPRPEPEPPPDKPPVAKVEPPAKKSRPVVSVTKPRKPRSVKKKPRKIRRKGRRKGKVVKRRISSTRKKKKRTTLPKVGLGPPFLYVDGIRVKTTEGLSNKLEPGLHTLELKDENGKILRRWEIDVTEEVDENQGAVPDVEEIEDVD